MIPRWQDSLFSYFQLDEAMNVSSKSIIVNDRILALQIGRQKRRPLSRSKINGLSNHAATILFMVFLIEWNVLFRCTTSGFAISSPPMSTSPRLQRREQAPSSGGIGWTPLKGSAGCSQTSTSALGTSTQEEIEQETKAGDDQGTSTPTGKTNDLLNVKTCDVLSLESIRSTLIRQEETIIFALIERAAFRSNSIVYEKSISSEDDGSNTNSFGCLGIPEGAVANDTNEEELQQLSFMEYMLLSTEVLHNKIRRYTSPEEHAFFPQFLPPEPMKNLPQLEYPPLLSPDGGASEINFNKCLMRRYLNEIIPAITQEGDDEQHGSTGVCDVNLLQALSRRVHYGKFVAESKYRSDPEGYQRLVDNDDHEGVMELLTNMAVENRLLRRVRLKASNYGREPLDIDIPFMDESGTASTSTSDHLSKSEERRMVAVAAATAVMAALESWDHHDGDIIEKSSKVNPYTIEAIYRDLIIPLTKDIEVAYLFKRCGKEPPPQYRGD